MCIPYGVDYHCVQMKSMSLFSSDRKSGHVKLIAEQLWHNSWFLLLTCCHSIHQSIFPTELTSINSGICVRFIKVRLISCEDQISSARKDGFPDASCLVFEIYIYRVVSVLDSWSYHFYKIIDIRFASWLLEYSTYYTLYTISRFGA